MVSDFIKDRINAAHAMIDEGYYEDAVKILKNIKYRVHDLNDTKEIEQFDKEHDDKLYERIKQIRNSSDDPLRQESNLVEQWKTYSQVYLRYYSRLAEDHDL